MNNINWLKTVLSFLLIFFVSSKLTAQTVHQQNISSEISAVTVFLAGAEVKREAEISVKKGINELRFTNISTSTDSRSIQFESKEKFDLLSISMERDFLSLSEKSDKIKNVKDSISWYQNKLQDIQDEKSAIETEKQLLIQNQKIGGENVNLTVAEIKSAADFYRTRMTEVNKKLSIYNKQSNDINDKIRKLNQQLAEYNYKENVKDNIIVVLLEVAEAGVLHTQLRYNVNNCGWAANYDLIAEDVSGKIQLKYKAKVYNNTGNDWKDVALKLSTGDPNLSASVPNLNPWYLNSSSFSSYGMGNNQYDIPKAQSRESNMYQQMNEFDRGEGRLQNMHTGDIMGTFSAPVVSMELIEVSELTTEFEIEKTYSIPSDSRPYIVEITEYELEGIFSHVAIPKLDKDAFLLAKITGWEKLDLVPGPSNVYFAQTYVGESNINTRNVEDTLGLSFGRDKKILVTRRKVEEFSNKKIVGSWKRDTYVYEIIVKNNRNRNISLELKDQIPISQDSDITVAVNEISGAKFSETDGLLTWTVQLQPGESKKYTISFEMKYPKSRSISVKNYRKTSAPRF